MSKRQDRTTDKKVAIEVDGVDAEEVADLLEEVAREIRASNNSGTPLEKNNSFTRISTGQLFDVVHRS